MRYTSKSFPTVKVLLFIFNKSVFHYNDLMGLIQLAAKFIIRGAFSDLSEIYYAHQRENSRRSSLRVYDI